MREKLLYTGFIALSALYVIEVFSHPGLGILQWIGLAIVVLGIIPWAISQFLALRKKKKAKEEKKQFKAFKAQKGEENRGTAE
ncbi:MAG: hypothetical protein RSJ41_00065 [Clostridia bacterium]